MPRWESVMLWVWTSLQGLLRPLYAPCLAPAAPIADAVAYRM